MRIVSLLKTKTVWIGLAKWGAAIAVSLGALDPNLIPGIENGVAQAFDAAANIFSLYLALSGASDIAKRDASLRLEEIQKENSGARR